MKYYVLGKNNNKMLFGYLDKYYVLLQEKIRKIADAGVCKDMIYELLGKDNKDFIMHPDYSSIINLLYSNYFVSKNNEINVGEYQNIFIQELDIFLYGDKKNLSMNQGSSLGGTNIVLTKNVYNPYDGKDPHPDHKSTGGILGYGEKSLEDWLEVYNKTFDLLKKIDEGIYNELNQIIKKIVPLGTSKGLHNSASYSEAIGDLYMGYTIDSNFPEINNLEAIIHESSHNKLNLILHFDKLICNDASERYYSPYRPDARHIHGIYLGVHAFVPTMYILMKAYLSNQIQDRGLWLEKIILYYFKNKISINVLEKHGVFTELGREILDEIKDVQKLTDNLFHKLDFSQELLIEMKGFAKSHFQGVNANYPNLLY